MMLSRTDRLMAVQLLFDSGFVEDGDVVAIIGSAINSLGGRGCYQLTVARPCLLTLRQRFILLQLLAESVLDDFPDPDMNLPPPENMIYARRWGHSHLAHVAHFMDPVMRRSCHIGCGCWRDTRG